MKKNQAWCVVGKNGVARISSMKAKRQECIEEFVQWNDEKGLLPWSDVSLECEWRQWKRLGFRCVKVKIVEVEK